MDNLQVFNPWYYYIGDKLIKEKKPLSPGDFVHLHSIEGCFKVYEVKINYFTILKNHTMKQIPWSEYRCKKGFGTSYETKIKRLINDLNSLKLHIDTIKNGLLSL